MLGTRAENIINCFTPQNQIEDVGHIIFFNYINIANKITCDFRPTEACASGDVSI